MARYLITNDAGLFTADIETTVASLSQGLERDQAEPLISTALLMSMAALTEGGDWPFRALAQLQNFMRDMCQTMQAEKLM